MELLCFWEAQREYERIRPLVLFDKSIARYLKVDRSTVYRVSRRRFRDRGEEGLALRARRPPSEGWT